MQECLPVVGEARDLGDLQPAGMPFDAPRQQPRRDQAEGGDRPEGELATAIDENFGSFEKFQEHFNGAALGLQGSGWAVLGYDHIAGRLIIQQLTDQQGNVSVDFTPVLMLDMWEHAFYLQYKNVKADYVKAVWNVFNWDDVAERYAAAKK